MWLIRFDRVRVQLNVVNVPCVCGLQGISTQRPQKKAPAFNDIFSPFVVHMHLRCMDVEEAVGKIERTHIHVERSAGPSKDWLKRI